MAIIRSFSSRFAYLQLLLVSILLIFPGSIKAQEAKTVRDGETLNLSATEVSFSTLRLGKNVTVHLSGTNLTAKSIESGEGLRLTGFGKISAGDFKVGENSVVDLSDISLSLGTGALTIAPGSSLTLSAFPILGGTVNFVTTVDGRDPSFTAPPRPLLGSTTVKGRFHSTEAYAEWFSSSDPAAPTADWAICINRAFQHSADGVVRLLSRKYSVASTIYVPTRGRLSGTSGLWRDSSSATDFKKEEGEWYGTKIYADHNGRFQSECLMLVNYNRHEVESGSPKNFSDLKKANSNGGEKPHLLNQAWLKPTSYISDIEFNMEGWHDSDLPSLCCILVAGTAWFDQLSFRKYRQAIVWSDHYSDLKKVTRCSFGLPRHQDEGDYYLLDFNFLGDALICEGNTFDSGYSTFNRHLRVSYCCGGNISSNIINGDILISNCKGLRVTDNHMENGMQTIIRNSEVDFSNNFIEKGIRPSIVIENPQINGNNVVSLRNNCFLYYSFPHSVLVNGKWTPTAPIHDAGENKISIAEVSDYDVELRAPVTEASGKQYPHGPRGVLNLLSNYRYWITNEGAYLMYTSGISLCKSFTKDGHPRSPTPVESFNSMSHIYSPQSTLLLSSEPVISFPSVKYNNITDVSVSVFGLNSNTRWYSSASTYSYYYQLIWDKKKGYVTTGPGPTTAGLGSLGKISIPADNAKGVLFLLQGATGTGFTAMVRMIRRDEATNRVEYCDFPIVSTNCFYDNGPTIGGYRWSKAESIEEAAFKGTLPPSPSLTYTPEGI